MGLFDFGKASKMFQLTPTGVPFSLPSLPAIPAVPNGRNVLSGLNIQFGIPTEMLGLSPDVLNALPTAILGDMSEDLEFGKKKALEVNKEVKRKVYLDLGVQEYDTDRGTFRFISTSSDHILNRFDLEDMRDIGGYGDALSGGNDVLLNRDLGENIGEVKNLMDKMASFKALQKGSSSVSDKFVGFNLDGSSVISPSELIGNPNVIYEVEKKRLRQSMEFINKVDLVRNYIAYIVLNRVVDPRNFPEPVVNGDALDASGIKLSVILEGTNIAFTTADTSGVGYCSLGTSYGDQQSCEFVGGIWTEGPEARAAKLPQELFSVKVGSDIPTPLSTRGRYILAPGGIYYNLTGGGISVPDNLEDIVVCSSILPKHSIRYMKQFDPNCGGKGDSITLKDFNEFARTLFDLEEDITELDNSPEIQEYYSRDTLLQTIYNERNKLVYDLSGYVSELIDDGHAEDSAILVNQRQTVLAAVDDWEFKAKKRKKQIQIAAVLGVEDGGPLPLGQVPINNFSFLSQTALTIILSKQPKLMFNPGEVSSVVLPLNVEYIVPDNIRSRVYLQHLRVTDMGPGGIIYGASSLSGTSSHTLSLNDHITKDGLFAAYNFLETELVAPDAEGFNVINTANDDSDEGRAQLVASSFDTVFTSGVSIPYLGGLCSLFLSSTKGPTYTASAQLQNSPWKPHSYVRLPEGDDFNSLMYRRAGFTIDTWIHMPDLSVSSTWGVDGSGEETNVSALYKILMGNENRGGWLPEEPSGTGAPPTKSLNSVRGCLIGFTRDRRIVSDLAASSEDSANPIDDNLKFFIAPTISTGSSINFFAKDKNPDSCVDDPFGTYKGTGFNKLSLDVSTTVNSVSLNSCSTTFSHVVITGDPKENANIGIVKIFVNGVEMTSGTYTEVFGFKDSPDIPSPILDDSFTYRNIYESVFPQTGATYTENSLGWSDFWYWEGPRPASFTPWIIGGGYTDGMTTRELGIADTSNEGMNFMGGTNGGVLSGLKGHIGSFKLYKKALSTAEVVKNYKAQQGYFENIFTGLF